jgi:hypothetical protein
LWFKTKLFVDKVEEFLYPTRMIRNNHSWSPSWTCDKSAEQFGSLIPGHKGDHPEKSAPKSAPLLLLPLSPFVLRGILAPATCSHCTEFHTLAPNFIPKTSTNI